MRSVIAQPKRSVFIRGWAFDGRLVPQGATDGHPEELGEFLKEAGCRGGRFGRVRWRVVEFGTGVDGSIVS